MAIENLFARDNPTFITNGAVKRQALDFAEYSYLNNPSLLEAVAQGEQRVDQINEVRLFTDLFNYPLTVAISKAIAAQEALARMNGNIKDTQFAVFDATWSTPEQGRLLYINKPACHPEGSVVGARAIVDFFEQNKGRPMFNSSTTVIFSLSEIATAYELCCSLGNIALFDNRLKQRLLKLAFDNRHSVSAGLNILDAWEEGLIEKPDMIELQVCQYRISDQDVKRLMNTGKIHLPWLSGSYRSKLDFNPEQKDLYLAWALGILPKGLVFPIDH